MRLSIVHAGAGVLLGVLAGAAAPVPAAAGLDAVPPPASATAKGTDHSGQARVGIASVYAHRFAGRRMADGRRMDPHDVNAASRTLPIGTEARVTNLGNGQSALC